MMSINVNVDYAADDSCQIKLWAKGHHTAEEFLTACELELKAWDDRIVDLSGKLIRHSHWRTVKADSETSSLGVCDFVHKESKPGKGAYAITELTEWLPLFTH
jgi:hypothetical protein